MTKSSELSDFVSIAVHQLKTPLVANKWALSELMNESAGKLSDEQKTLIKKIIDSNERAITLAGDILRAEALETAVFDLVFSQLSVNQLLREIIEGLREEAVENNIEINLEQGDIPEITGDREKLYYVFENIIANAIHYTRAGGKVAVKTEYAHEEIKIVVADNGIGIPEDEQANIFKKFFRAKNLRGHETNGSGLGLFISKDIIEKHNGSIGFQSEEGHGTSFTISLPIKQEG